ncbi:hypothetical protein [Acidithiobacillus thiooxidans]|uniref:hypothetical protein n=1 Tax=Acidithiobacillus thiooxidans TaxID=930 RepID=UPI00129E8A7D|nr:hypothetical protein [Acidithiobacillus thiooxidans]
MQKRIKRPQSNEGDRIRAPRSSKGSRQSLHPKSSFEKMSSSHSVFECETEEKAALADTLYKLGQMTWAQIMQTDRHKSGCETISLEEIKAPGKDAITPDSKVLAFRFSGMKPMIGYRLDETFYVVWLDRAFKIYGHS